MEHVVNLNNIIGIFICVLRGARQGQAAGERRGLTRPRALRPPRRGRGPGNPRLRPPVHGGGQGARRGKVARSIPPRAEAQSPAGTFWNSPAQRRAGRAQARPRPRPEQRRPPSRVPPRGEAAGEGRAHGPDRTVAGTAAAGSEAECGPRWPPPGRARGAAAAPAPAPARRLRGQGCPPRRGKRTAEGARRGRLKEGAGRGARGRGAQGGVAGRLRSCQSLKARARSAGACFRRPGAFRPSSASGPPRSPPLLRPGSRLGPEPRAEPPGMPRYELALILKAMQRPETAAALKRTLEALMDRGAIVRHLENLGDRALPYRISAHNQRHVRGGVQLLENTSEESACGVARQREMHSGDSSSTVITERDGDGISWWIFMHQPQLLRA
ncbi:28S ribosomal protein S6, mitochondrial [Canis lupus dingo]|uniref:28S ribosomal protein S6, mitochondrial n=1 Tax=Canis lupus dingo TaxID=286419 RepID=UPI0020C234E0|nr:28S ribosomal protein S6, mitochondrial [Canis lupus dingo]